MMLLGVAPLAVLAQSGNSETLLVQPAIDNFDRVSNQLFRGALPSDEALKQLAGQGVKTVIDLRLNGEGTEHEKQVVDRLGIKYVHIPLGMRPPTNEQIVTFMTAVNDQSNQPVFVHCRHGADRTGTLVGIYRILMQNWTFDRVYSEMRAHHFKTFFIGMKRSVVSIAENRSTQEMLRAMMASQQNKAAISKATALNDLEAQTKNKTTFAH